MDTTTFLENIIGDELAKLPPNRHDNFMQALRHSLTVPPERYTPESFDVFGFTQRELYNHRVLLLRPLAYTFIQSIRTDISKSHFDKRTTYDAYEFRFGHQPWLISTRPRIMLLTYTEWLALVLNEIPEIPFLDRL